MVTDILNLLAHPIISSLLVVSFLIVFLLVQLTVFDNKDQCWLEKAKSWQGTIAKMIASLPLLGLLGTISGLLSTFGYISTHHSLSHQEVMTGGISDALITTKLGLILAIPCLLFLELLKYKCKKFIQDQT